MVSSLVRLCRYVTARHCDVRRPFGQLIIDVVIGWLGAGLRGGGWTGAPVSATLLDESEERRGTLMCPDVKASVG